MQKSDGFAKIVGGFAKTIYTDEVSVQAQLAGQVRARGAPGDLRRHPRGSAPSGKAAPYKSKTQQDLVQKPQESKKRGGLPASPAARGSSPPGVGEGIPLGVQYDVSASRSCLLTTVAMARSRGWT